MAQKPLMLKDYLELDSCAESFWWPPLQRSGSTTVRSLLETELGGGAADKGGWRLVRSRSKVAFTRLSAVIKLLQFSAEDAPPRFLPRSISKKLGRSFWKKRGYEKGNEGEIAAKDIVRLRSFHEETVDRGSLFFPCPAVSSCSSSSDLFADGKESVLISSITEKEAFASAGEDSRRPEPEEICGKGDMDCPFEEEKEQLSPVSVMDFPYQDEDEDEAVVEQPSAISPCFEQSIINIERTKHQLLQKIRRFESIANLDRRFACDEVHAQTTVHVETDEEEAANENEVLRRRRPAFSLLRRLADNHSIPSCFEKLLFDFFVEGLSLAEDCWRVSKSGCADDEELLRLAHDWVAGVGNAAAYDGQMAVGEMERSGGGWKRCEGEEEIVAVEMTGDVVTWLTEELVDDLLVSVE